MIKASVKLGNMTIGFEGGKMQDLFKWSGLVSSFPTKCDKCESTNLFPSHRNVKSFDFYEIKCGDCGAGGKVGETKEDNSMFYKYDTKMEQYVASQQTSQQTAPPQQNDDLPF